MHAFTNQLGHKALLATFAPQFSSLTAKVQYRQFALGISLAQCTPFTFAAARGFVDRRMKRRVAHAQVKTLGAVQHVQQDLLRIGLQAQADGFVQTVGLHDRLGRFNGGRVNFGAQELPAVFAVTNQRVHAVCTHADVQHAHARTARDDAIVHGGQQVGQKVHVVSATRHRRAQVVSRNVPVGDTVERLEQRAVEYTHGIRVGEVDALFAIRVDDDELGQLRAHRNQLREVIAALVAVARVQAGLDARLDRFGIAGSLGLVACGFGSARGSHVQFIPQKQSRARPLLQS